MTFRLLLSLSICAGGLTACNEASDDKSRSVDRGQFVYAKECAACHGAVGEGAGSASLGLGVAAPDLTGLRQRNDGQFPREFVRRFVMGVLEKDDPDAAMPDFARVGLRHVYPEGGADGEVLETDFEALLDYLEAIQR
ncbi:cytochrome c [Tateyamaria armeniaca]|uniref:Cytochrome c n=1 Tax=Tateyamaria armeniaca TaxID=2518930 RepID=A0ABW8UVI9_9RHOB